METKTIVSGEKRKFFDILHSADQRGLKPLELMREELSIRRSLREQKYKKK